MARNRTAGIIFAGLWLTIIFMIGAYLPTLPPEKVKIEDQPINLPSVSNPELARDRDASVKIMGVARQIAGDFDYLSKQYDQIPMFNPLRDIHLKDDEVERYVIAVSAYLSERKNFMDQTVGERPGLYRVLAFVGMINNYHEVMRMRSLVRINMTAEEFEWIRQRIMEAGLVAVLSALEDGQWESEEQKKHLESLRDNMYWAVGAATVNEAAKGLDIHPEKYDRTRVPRSNVELFLKYYRRPNQPGIYWPKIRFDSPTQITFNHDTIMAKAANNPP